MWGSMSSDEIPPAGQDAGDRRKSSAAVSAEGGDALTRYFQQISAIPMLSAEEQQRLGDEIDAAAGRLRRRICRCGFVADEYL